MQETAHVLAGVEQTAQLQVKTAGLLAEYDTAGAIYHAAERVRDAGYTKWDVHTPFPVHGMDVAMGLKPTPMGFISLAGGLTGGSLAVLMQWWMNGYDYPLVVGGKPPGALQAFVPITFELTILLCAFATFFGMLTLNRLPMWYHWVFGSRRFERVTDDRFFISIEATDPKFDLSRTKAILENTHPLGVEEVKEEELVSRSGTLRENMGLTVEALTGITAPFAPRQSVTAKETHEIAEGKLDAAIDKLAHAGDRVTTINPEEETEKLRKASETVDTKDARSTLKTDDGTDTR